MKVLETKPIIELVNGAFTCSSRQVLPRPNSNISKVNFFQGCGVFLFVTKGFVSIMKLWCDQLFGVYVQRLNPMEKLNSFFVNVATPLWAKCEGEAHTPKSGNLESSGTPKNSELELKGQNTLHWGVLGVIGKVLKCRCLNWPRIGHLDICSPSYGQKKGRKSNWQFDSRPLKVGNGPLSDVCSGSATWRWKALEDSYNIGLDLAPIGLGSREI
jgi:hypothetical protein